MAYRDPLYPQILERLGGELDPQTFEDAVCDLLRDSFPSLVPIRGGSDAGRDGAIADGEGEAFPLVCTTGGNVIGNLRKSLESYLRDGGRRDKVVLVTSQELTPRRRSNLEKRARDLGFTLAQVVDRHGIAHRLYRDAGWRLKLLGLAGTPEALSVVPLSRQPFLDLSPVGRDDDLSWLQTTTGDRVLSGQPGSGKTFLLQHLIRKGWPGLFLVSQNETEIANTIRAQAPGFVVIVDDAHTELDALVRLCRLRKEIGAEFTILATTWEGNLASVVEALGFPAAVRKLDLLTRPEILEVYRQAGITEDNTDPDLLREFVNQASNRPGLAATLALLWLRGAWKEILSGNALSRHVRETFRSLIGADAAPLLAAFALGGDRGIPMAAVGQSLGLSLADLWRQTAALAAGGALFPIEPDVLAVRPRPLRSALIGTVFFPEPSGVALSYHPLLDRAPSFGSAVAALVQARLDGVPVPDGELRDLVSRADALDPWRQMREDDPKLRELMHHSDVFAAWQGLTFSSEENARWALEHYPGDPLHLAREALLRVPQDIIPLLLSRAVEFPGSSDQPLLTLKHWIREPLEPMQRRLLLAKEITKYLGKGGNPAAGLRALSLALSPGLETLSLDPGIGNRVKFTPGMLSEPDLRKLGSVWAAVRGELRSLPPESWPSLDKILWEWTDPEHIAPGASLVGESRRILHDLAASVIRDLAPLVRTSPGLASELRPFAEQLGLAVDLPADSVFEALFPKPDIKTALAPDPIVLVELAATWSEESPRDVARHLAYYEREARQIDRRWPRHTPGVCRELAARVDALADWLDAFFEERLPGDLAEPFLKEILKRRPEDWDAPLGRWLDTDAWGWTVASLLAGVTDLPSSLAEQTLARLEAQPRLTYILTLRSEICPPMLRALLRSSQEEAALAAAAGTWLARSKGDIPPDLKDDWREAVVQACGKIEDRSVESSLAQVLAKDPGLAFEWLRACIQSGSIPDNLSFPHTEKRPFRTALSALDAKHRESLLANLVSSSSLRGLLPHLIGKDLALYRQFLGRADLREYHLAPLQGLPDAEWIPLALAAAESGWEDREIAEAAIPSFHSHWGTGLEYWSRWQRSFAALEDDPHEEIRAIGKAGQDLVKPWIADAQEREKQIALYGL